MVYEGHLCEDQRNRGAIGENGIQLSQHDFTRSVKMMARPRELNNQTKQ